MNNLHRELAPVSAAAWASIEQEARRTFTLHLAGRRVTDVTGPASQVLAAVGTGHLSDLRAPADGIIARARIAQPVIELRVPFAVSRQAADDVERGALDPDWQPVKDAAHAMAMAEDRAIFDGYPAGGMTGIRRAASNAGLMAPGDAISYPDLVSGALETLRQAGVGGPFALVLSAQAYTAVSETSDHGYPVRQHLASLVEGPVVRAPGIEGGFVLSGRGGDFELVLGQDLSIGYLSHDIETVTLYFEEAFTFLTHTPEAVVPISAVS